MNTKLVLAAVAIVIAFGIAAMIGPVTIPAPPALAQNMTTGENMTMGAGNMTAGNMTGASGT
jgi:hypothetical protein